MVIMGGLLIYIAALTPKRMGEEAELEINIEREIPSGDDPVGHDTPPRDKAAHRVGEDAV